MVEPMYWPRLELMYVQYLNVNTGQPVNRYLTCTEAINGTAAGLVDTIKKGQFQEILFCYDAQKCEVTPSGAKCSELGLVWQLTLNLWQPHAGGHG